ncbi:hypothetical protein [Ensifer adhaerens]|uniref:hypothetical protein n=1 Tax=Ensifer adhaerens TaxID=106592 RepID=UPI00156A4364|nr:hypothetical protein [Ensifer adhaerens]
MTAFFDSRSLAEAVVERLRELELGSASVQLVMGSGSQQDIEAITPFWSALENFFFPAEDRKIYAEGLNRGGYLVAVAGIGGDEYAAVREILDDDGAINLDERVDVWFDEGWSGMSPGDRDPLLAHGSALQAIAPSSAAPAAEQMYRDHSRSSNRLRAYSGRQTPVPMGNDLTPSDVRTQSEAAGQAGAPLPTVSTPTEHEVQSADEAQLGLWEEPGTKQ